MEERWSECFGRNQRRADLYEYSDRQRWKLHGDSHQFFGGCHQQQFAVDHGKSAGSLSSKSALEHHTGQWERRYNKFRRRWQPPNRRTIAYYAPSNQLFVVSRANSSSANFTINVLNATTGVLQSARSRQMASAGLALGLWVLRWLRTARSTRATQIRLPVFPTSSNFFVGLTAVPTPCPQLFLVRQMRRVWGHTSAGVM